MFDRRQFLIGAGGLLTTAFVNRAKGFSRRHYEPLLVPADLRPEETLYLNSGFGEYAKWRASLGSIAVEAPPPPTWREHLRDLGVSLEADDEIRRACNERGMELQDLDKRVDAFGWEDRWGRRARRARSPRGRAGGHTRDGYSEGSGKGAAGHRRSDAGQGLQN